MNYRDIAEMLAKAENERKPLDQLTVTYPDLTVQDAYNIQLEGIALKQVQGRKIIGKKIGLTSKGMQKLLGVNEPDYGHLLDNMLLLEGEACRRTELLLPKIEGELAFVLKDKLKGPGVTIADVLRATEGVMCAFEIVDSRIRDWKIKLADTIADNGSSARLVLGSRLVPVQDLDLRLIGRDAEK